MDDVVMTEQLTKKSRGRLLVSGVNLHIRRGEIYGFLGQNGAGKTTIMKMLTGIMRPTSGEIMLFGKKLTSSEKSGLKRVGSIIEYPIFFEHLTAMDNLQLHCEYLGFYDKKAILQAIDMVHLNGQEGKMVSEYSLGMKQRLGIARAMITKPELIILDEPTNGLDPIGIKDMRDLIRMLNKEYGISFLLSSHILGEIEQVADRIGVIKDGKLVNEVNLEDIRKMQTNYIEITTKDVDTAAFLLEHKLQINNMKIMNDRQIRIYDQQIAQSEISKMLILHDVDIEAIQKHSHSLEDYFYGQIHGGGKVG
ncbi:ATP-binding cassette domain-containing protein [Paenibacillus urinalis]|uniref:ATP-binding cassette domain-containing protein n=1 Tax=Paenibacillus urinalis TaxID=521520 RepID=A0AAX3MWV0_9BACL|nr:ATP-binding cassette domain-containing protein [Paenibacillus urinalis]WDH82098.1 ATP-binding cassette domain-containing protein [Paenibacillus urinalis]WDH98153.1 ATP-binding cassette domain-containing protein [Paenibacillus urinalis]WDI01836.1 ATP-binding cassette domain-containing protein [Paenibacillus urinalis]